ncbi:MAG: DUF4159 domain-containing protein [Flavobacteriales bacterium]|nr:DUF4159 domain-containing protein [Flavobacteriales bacterium]
MIRIAIILIFVSVTIGSWSQTNYAYQFAVMKYNGGGDWYSNPTSIPNLVDFCNSQGKMNINPDVAEVHVSSSELYNYPFIHMTGHGNVVFNNQEAENLRNYLISGGFLHIDDNYGMDKFIRPQMKKVFPELEFVELSYAHPIYHQAFNFEKGLPKIHLHDNKAAQGFGLIYKGRLVCFYSYESDLGDGWEDEEVHNDSNDIRTKALKMGLNMIQYAFMGGTNGN